jgi:ABC-type amino acid transport substrate-binding protein
VLEIIIIVIPLLAGYFGYAQQDSFQTTKNVLRIGTMDLSPYGWIDKQGHKHGIVYDIGNEIAVRAGMKYTNEILPFVRMFKLMKEQKIDLLSSQAHAEAEASGNKLAICWKVNVFAISKKGSGIQSLQDLKDKTVIYHLGSSYKQLEGLPKKILRVPNYEQALKMLYRRSDVDAAVISEAAYYYFMNQMGLTSNDFGKVLDVERDKDQWIFVRKGMPQATREKLKAVVDEIYREKLYDKTVQRYVTEPIHR